ncbi:MAG TPA: hypothetical protein VFA63_09085 [Pseudonocardiaceae bacterium]|nr:hypothetical protein [Pseudonocardiaceae bacterium]
MFHPGSSLFLICNAEELTVRKEMAGMRRQNIVKAAVVGAALALVIPGIAAASTSSVVRTPGSTPWNMPGAGQEKITDADCNTGELASGGGVNVTGNNDIHLLGNPPSANGTSPATSTDTNVTHWLGIAGTGGMGTGNYSVQPFVVCFSNSAITATHVVVASASGPAGTSGATASTTATCDTGRLIGGGVRSQRADNKSVHEIASFPSDSSGAAASGGSTNPTSWTVWTENGGMGAPNPNTTTVYAICGTNSGTLPTVTVQHTHASSAFTSGTQQTTTGTGCGTGTTLVSGGAAISGSDPTSGSFTAPGSQGDHLIGDYPSTATGGLPTTGTTQQNWTAIGQTGGMGSSGAYTDAWALCMA